MEHREVLVEQVAPSPPAREVRLGGVTLRAIAIALIIIALFAPAGYYGELVYGSTYMFASGVPSMGSLVVLFLLTFVNGLVRRSGRNALTRAEVLATYAIVLVGGPLMTHGILAWMVGHNITPRFLSLAIPQWLTSFLAAGVTPDWFTPQSRDALENYFNGGARVPWGEWATPLSAWGSFMVALFFATLFVVLLFRNQWITNERLSFPTAQIPLEFVGETETKRGRVARLPIGPMFWIGFGLIFGIEVINTLGTIWPSVPGIPLTGKVLMQWVRVGPMAGLGEIDLWLDPSTIGIAYLIPKELAFSCWFFYILRVIQTVVAISAGATPAAPEDWYDSTFPAPYYQGGGAVIALGLWVLWIGRRHIARAFRLAFTLDTKEAMRELVQGHVARAFRLAVTGQADPQDPKSPVTYRWQLVGFLLSFGYMVWFCAHAGSRVWFGAVLCVLLISLYVMWARLRAETGLGFLPFPLGVESMMLVPFGSATFRPQEVANLISLRWTYFPGFGESYEVVTGNSLEAFKIADVAKIRERRLLTAMIVGFVISLGVGLYMLMWGMYHYGFYNINAANSGWLQSQMRGVGGRMHEMITNPSPWDLNGTIGLLAGAAVAITLGLMRLRFWWWPLHPFGYLAANCWGMHWYWQSFFVGWLFKTLVIRYGGLRLYRHTVPLAIGCIMGSMVGSGLHVLVATVVRSQM